MHCVITRMYYDTKSSPDDMGLGNGTVTNLCCGILAKNIHIPPFPVPRVMPCFTIAETTNSPATEMPITELFIISYY